jgi:putative Holliday junction resolvase
MDGTEGTAAEKVRRFAEELGRHLAVGVRIEYQDEYGSTLEAAADLRASGRKARRQRPVIDQAAAVVILRDWLEARRVREGLE